MLSLKSSQLSICSWLQVTTVRSAKRVCRFVWGYIEGVQLLWHVRYPVVFDQDVARVWKCVWECSVKDNIHLKQWEEDHRTSGRYGTASSRNRGCEWFPGWGAQRPRVRFSFTFFLDNQLSVVPFFFLFFQPPLCKRLFLLSLKTWKKKTKNKNCTLNRSY